jgi:hypothetical protein
MATIIETDLDLINRKVSENIQSSLSDYSARLSSAPAFTYYFNRRMPASTHDINLDSVYKTVGTNSPNYFNRIENFPIYNLEQLSLELSEGNYGQEADIESSCIILPGTVLPFVDDYIFVPYINPDTMQNSYALFRVTAVNKGNFGSIRFFRLSITYSQDDLALVEENVLEELEFNVTDYEENRTPILKKTTSEKLKLLRQYRRTLAEQYKKYFFDRDLSVLKYRLSNDDDGNPQYFVDWILQTFIERSKIFQFDRTYYNSFSGFFTPDDITSHEYIENVYDLTFYTLIDSVLNKDNIIITHFRFSEFEKNRTSVFYSVKGKIINPSFLPEGHEYLDDIYSYTDENFISQIKENVPYEDNANYWMENVIIRYANAPTDENNLVDYPDDTTFDINIFLEYLRNKKVQNNLRNFFLIPFILAVARRYEDFITSKKKEFGDSAHD